MKVIYYISTLGLTRHIVNHTEANHVPVLNETLRPHLDDPEDWEGDHVHADLSEARRLARDIVFDIGSKGIDVLAIRVEDADYDALVASGDIRDSKRSDPYGGRLLKLSQAACKKVNGCCTAVATLNWMVPSTAQDALASVH
jgi:hypothetical protein